MYVCMYFSNTTIEVSKATSDISVSKINLVSITVLCVTGFFLFLLYFSFEILSVSVSVVSCQFSNHFYFSFNFSFYFRFRVYYIDQ